MKSDGNRPDGMNVVPWWSGHWDATCPEIPDQKQCSSHPGVHQLPVFQFSSLLFVWPIDNY